jgi:outer membrane protein
MKLTRQIAQFVVWASAGVSVAVAQGPVAQGPAAQGPAALPDSPGPAVSLVAGTVAGQAAPSGAPVAITLDEAVARARINAPLFNAAMAAAKNAELDRSIARAQLLPQVVYHNQFVYSEAARYAHAPTQADIAAGRPAFPGAQAFVANNGVHEYVSQASVTETVGLAGYLALSRAKALASVANAELEISRRGLSATVVTLFYTVTAAETKVTVEQQALDEANRFVTLTQHREDAREVAHADVIKAQLTQMQRERDLADARLAAEKARLDLGVLLFPDPRTPYALSVAATRPLEAKGAFEAAANTNNPELHSAFALLDARRFDVGGAQSAYLPNLSVNYLYGIDAGTFGVNGRRTLGSPYDDALRNLGYAASATLDIPVFDWFATPNRIRQARNLRDAAKTVLSSAQRTLIAQLQEFYNEATVAQQQQQSLAVSATTAAESLRLTQLRYTAGEATVLEVVDAQTTLTLAQLAQADGAVRYQVALANLQLLTGTL